MKWHYRYAGEMLALYRKGFAATRAGVLVRLRWTDSGMRLAEFRAEFIRALNRRINAKAGETDCRKLSSEWQAACQRDYQRLHDIARRVRVYQFETCEVSRRFAHLLADREEI